MNDTTDRGNVSRPGTRPGSEPDPEGHPEARQRIFDAAVRLFARSGYAAVGVREIAAEADVNIAMISYYYGGKVGLLKQIVSRFFDRYQEIATAQMRGGGGLEKRIRGLVRELVGELKQNRDLWKIGFLEMPFDVPQIARLKAERVQALREAFRANFIVNTLLPREMERRLEILGPAFVSMMFSTFLLEPVVDEAFEVVHDDEFYERYVDTIATLFLSGIRGFIKPARIIAMAKGG